MALRSQQNAWHGQVRSRRELYLGYSLQSRQLIFSVFHWDPGQDSQLGVALSEIGCSESFSRIAYLLDRPGLIKIWTEIVFFLGFVRVKLIDLCGSCTILGRYVTPIYALFLNVLI